MGCFAAFQAIVTSITGAATWWTQFSALDWIKSATLFDYFVGEQDIVNGVLWYLAPLMMLYLFSFMFLNVAHKKPLCFIAILQGGLFAGACAEKCTSFSASWITWCPFLEFFIAGILLYLLTSGRIKPLMFVLHMIITYLVYLFCTYDSDLMTYPPYLVSYCYAYFIFVLAYLFEDKISGLPGQKMVKWLSTISYSFYITHSLYGGMLISALVSRIGFSVAFLIAVPFCVITAHLNYRMIERPIGMLRRFI